MLQEDYHKVYIKEINSDSSGKMILYSDLESLKREMEKVFELGDFFEVQYELNLDLVTVEEYIEILNLNPFVEKIETSEKFNNIDDFFEWVDANETLFLIDSILKES